MTEKEIEIIERVRLWMAWTVRDTDDSSARRECESLVDALDDIIRKYRT